jgi:outer membrane protein assembly factor BamB
MKRTGMVCVLVLALISLALSACASSTVSRPSAPAPAATHASTATPTPVPPPPVNAYLGAGDTVYALDGRTGARLWIYDTGQHTGSGDILRVYALDDTVYFTDTADYTLYALDKASGALRWKAKGVEPTATRIVVESGIAYVTSAVEQAPSVTLAINVQSGAVLWHLFGGGDMALDDADNILFLANTLPGSDAEPVTNGFIKALNRADGTLRWQVTGHPFSHLLLSPNALYATTDDTLYAFEPKTGAALWSKRLGGFELPIQLNGNTLYLDDAQQMTAFDVISQSVLWSFPLTSPSSLAYGSTAICVGNPGHVYGLRPATGVQLWSKQDANGYVLLGQANGMCYARTFTTAEGSPLTTADGSPLSAFDAQTGAIRWTADLKYVYNAFILTPTTIYALTSFGPGIRGGIVKALSIADGAQLWQFQPDSPFPGGLAVG